MDEMILQYGLNQISNKAAADELKRFLKDNPGWFSRVMFAAREMKEQYFTNEDYYFENNEKLETMVKIFGAGKAFKLPLVLSPEIVETYVISEPHPLLDKQSFESKLKNMLKMVHLKVKEREPKVVILTGGPSRMRFFQELCSNEFKQSKIIISKEPEFDISRGLSYAGSVDEKAAQMLAEIKRYVRGNSVETKVAEKLPELIDSLSNELADAMIYQCAVPALRKWKVSDYSDTLDDLKDDIAVETNSFFESEAGKTLVSDACTPWTKALMEEVQEDLDEIALKHKVNLNKLQSGAIALDSDSNASTAPADNISKLITNVVGVIVGIIIAMICGGAGTALIATGPIGIIIGVVIAAAVFFVGKDYVEEKVMEIPFPKLVRKAITESSITKQKNIENASKSIRENLSNNTELVSSLTMQVSEMIDENLSKLVAETETQIVA